METLCGLFGKSKQAYYKHKRKSFSELEIEREVLSIVATYRAEMPLIGGLKLYYLTRSVLGDAMPEAATCAEPSIIRIVAFSTAATSI